MPKINAQQDAIQLAIEDLRDVDIAARCPALGLPQPQHGEIELRLFGEDMVFRCTDFLLLQKPQQQPASLRDRILFLHYLQCQVPVRPGGDLISFRDLPGGMFYWGPFRTRSIQPLIRTFGNDLTALESALDRFDWQRGDTGDLCARIHLFGSLYATLVYHLGDDEFPPAADLLFDPIFKHTLPTEDATVIASRICGGVVEKSRDA